MLEPTTLPIAIPGNAVEGRLQRDEQFRRRGAECHNCQADDERVDGELLCERNCASNQIVACKHKDDEARNQGQDAQHAGESTLAG
jgi:hypothetical protein